MKRINKNKIRKIISVVLLIIAVCTLLYLYGEKEGLIHCSCFNQTQSGSNTTNEANQTNDIDIPIYTSSPISQPTESTNSHQGDSSVFVFEEIPESDGITPYVEVNNNYPYFSDEDKERRDPFEEYSELDSLGRCGVAYANICVELMPTEKRGDIGSIKPTGWVQKKYDKDLVEGGYVWNRCHLIGFQLAGENANKLNLITGSRYMNVTGMLVFEDQVADYVKDEPKNHVLYRVTPVFVDDELVARGVLIEAYSVEDEGSLCFCVFCYNIQPGIEIDYQTGETWLMEED